MKSKLTFRVLGVLFLLIPAGLNAQHSEGLPSDNQQSSTEIPPGFEAAESADSPTSIADDPSAPNRAAAEAALETGGWCAAELSQAQKAFLDAYAAGLTPAADARGGGIIYLPVVAHVVGTDEGQGYFNLDYLMTAICELNERFAPTNFHFTLQLPVDFIDNSDYYNQDFSTGLTMMIQNNVDSVVNMYFVGGIGNSSGGSYIAGYYSPSGDALVVRNGNASPGNTTIAHEFGHFFSLPHTFRGWEYGTPSLASQEQVDGDNCTTAGDRFCDTPPDYAPYPWFCPSVGPFTDPDGVEFFVTDSFIMSYAQNCPEYFSAEQHTAMYTYVVDEHDDLIRSLVPYEPTGPVVTTLLLPEDGAEGIDPDEVALSWNAVDDAIAYHVSVAYSSTFFAIAQQAIVSDTALIFSGLQPDRSHFWKVKPLFEGYTCAPYTEKRRFSTGSRLISGLNAPDKSEDWTLFPNPATAGSAIRLRFDADGTPARISLRDAAGRLLALRELHPAKGSVSISMELPAGISGTLLVGIEQASELRNRLLLVTP